MELSGKWMELKKEKKIIVNEVTQTQKTNSENICLSVDFCFKPLIKCYNPYNHRE